MFESLPVHALDPIPALGNGCPDQTAQALLQAMKPAHAAALQHIATASQAHYHQGSLCCRLTIHSNSQPGTRECQEELRSRLVGCAVKHFLSSFTPGWYSCVRQGGSMGWLDDLQQGLSSLAKTSKARSGSDMCWFMTVSMR